MQRKFKKLIKILESESFPCKVSLIRQTSYQIIIELGFDYPVEVSDRVNSIFDSLKISHTASTICASASGYDDDTLATVVYEGKRPIEESLRDSILMGQGYITHPNV
jgi:hypothetical protein